jgi:hypothetical protein
VGFHHCVAIRKLFLTDAAVEKHIKWARDNWKRDWNTTLWIDESTIKLGKCPGHLHVTHRPGKEYLPECIQPTFHSGRQSLMVWGAIAHRWKGPLVWLSMNDEAVEGEAKPKKKKQGGRGLNGGKYVSQVL